MDLKKYIRNVDDFPINGVIFRDITPLLLDPHVFDFVIDTMKTKVEVFQPDCIATIDARGFIFAAPIANKLKLPLIPIRKPGKLPFETVSISYDLEYGRDSLEIHIDAFVEFKKVILIDDILATGGTLNAACNLIEQMNACIMGIVTVIELVDLNGRNLLKSRAIESLVRY
jgi:adenine phosphoribosyltransferase